MGGPEVFSPTSPIDSPDDEPQSEVNIPSLAEAKRQDTPILPGPPGAGEVTPVGKASAPPRPEEAERHSSPGLNSDNEDASMCDDTEVARPMKSFESKGMGDRTSEGGLPVKNPFFPRLLVGPSFRKELVLKPNRWMRIGRSKKDSHVFLNCERVSKFHCSIRWERGERKAELRDESSAGTMVNTDMVRGTKRYLEHGDRIIIARGYEFVLDMRPVFEELKSPACQPSQAPSLEQRRQNLEAQLVRLEDDIENFDKQAFEKERDFYAVAARRQRRKKEDAKNEAATRAFQEKSAEIKRKLEEDRDNWWEKCHVEQVKNSQLVSDLTRKVSDYQLRLEKLLLRKAEIQRAVYPERFALIGAEMDLPMLGGRQEPMLQLPAGGEDTTKQPEDGDAQEPEAKRQKNRCQRQGPGSRPHRRTLWRLQFRGRRRSRSSSAGSEDRAF
mmetsp:Transcript_2092/g.4762  ORF Transcript_2092/g.4762 Transcript_2092/m.4762 type:complete len:442 (+) Transcript_2092:51-1376(+)